jgi:hypothetical protein
VPIVTPLTSRPALTTGALILTLTALLPATGTANAAPPGPAGPASRTVTMATGDRVTVARQNGRTPLVNLAPGPGRKASFATVVANGSITVTPLDARARSTRLGLDGRVKAATTPLPARSEAAGEPGTVDLTIPTTDRDGNPGSPYRSFVLMINTATGESFYPPVEGDGVARAQVPAGTYEISGTVDTGTAWSSGFMRVTSLEAGSRVVPFDARETMPVELTNDQPGAVLSQAVAQLVWQSGGRATGLYLRGDAHKRISVQAASDPGLSYHLSTLWEQGENVFRDHTYTQGSIPSNPGQHTRKADLAQIRTNVRSQGVAANGWLRWTALDPASGLLGGEAMGVTRPVPDTFTVYLRPSQNVKWHSSLWLYGSDPYDGTTEIFRGPRVYRPGPQVDVMNAAAMGHTPDPQSASTRTGDALHAETGCPFTGALDDCGMDGTLGGSLTLSKGDTVLADKQVPSGWNWYWLDAALPPEAATYTLRESLTRQSAQATLATKTESIWTFRSSHTTQAQKLPLLSVAFMPAPLNANNSAPKGKPTVVPYWVRRGTPDAAPATIKIEASFDDGATWKRPPLTGTPAAGAVTITPPSGAEFVSLRATATDAAGNGVLQTVTRAYRVG